jgi:hypothetical protein
LPGDSSVFAIGPRSPPPLISEVKKRSVVPADSWIGGSLTKSARYYQSSAFLA